MKQIPFSINTVKELHNCIEQVREESRSLHTASVLVSVFMDASKKEMLDDIRKAVQAVFPEAQLVGAVSSGEIVNGNLMDKGVVVNFTLYEKSQVRVLAYDFRESDSQKAGADLLAVLQADKDVAAVELISAGFHLDINPFLHKLSESCRKIIFFGGLADDGSLGQNGMVFTQGQSVRHGVVAVVFSGSSLHVKTVSSFGWKPLGRTMTVTSMDGDYCLRSLDGRPPLEFYERYLGIHNTESFWEESLVFPFYFERHNTVLARHARRCLGDGSMMFGADLKEGEQLRLAYGDPGEILDNTMEIQDKMASFQPEGIFMVSCVARWMLLGSDTVKELTISRHLAPSSGFYAYGEFMRNEQGEIMVSNMTLVTVGMREGVSQGRQSNIIPPAPKLKKHRSIMAHLVRFIEMTNRELEETNRQLKHQAQTDQLTGLFNRGETEGNLKTLLERTLRNGQEMSVIMLDVDDFKVINDTYGHDVGDATLKLIADILKKNTRKGTDIPGRWGGDEFFVILPETTRYVAAEIAQRICRSIEQATILPDGTNITASIGVVSADREDTPGTLFKRVDEALYAAKQVRGKNDVVVR